MQLAVTGEARASRCDCTVIRSDILPGVPDIHIDSILMNTSVNLESNMKLQGTACRLRSDANARLLPSWSSILRVISLHTCTMKETRQ